MATEATKRAPNPTRFVTGELRLSYINVFTPRASEDEDGNKSEPKYSLCGIFSKSDKATLAKFNAAIEAVKADPAAIAEWGGKVPLNLKTPLRDGDEEREGEEYKGNFFFNCSSKQKPGVVDADIQEILDQSKVYSGVYGRVSVNLYAYNKRGNKGIAVGLGNVQVLRDGEPLGGRTLASDDFGPAANEDDGGFLG